jgi:hypothetical protein
MSNEVIVRKGRYNVVSVDLGIDVSAETLTSQIRSEPHQDAPLIAEWDVAFETDGTDGHLILTMTTEITSQIKATSGFMDIKRLANIESLPGFDTPLAVTFQGTVTA